MKTKNQFRLLDFELDDPDITAESKSLEYEERNIEARKRSVAHNSYTPGRYDCLSEMHRSPHLRLMEWYKMIDEFYD